MRTQLARLALIALLAAGCGGLKPEELNPEQLQTFEALEAAEQTAVARLAEARATHATSPSPSTERAVADAREQLRLVKGQFARFEARVMRERAGPIVGLIASMLGPVGTTLSPLVLGLVPLLGKRGRMHYANALRKFNPLSPAGSADGKTRTVAPVQAALDILRALGALHSSKASEAAANGESTIITTGGGAA